jgi:predicted flap endonuclease-1-like 5' DNA nuclease
MGSFGCILWWCLLGGLLGWLASWLFGRRKPVVVEKIVDRPVDRIVEKIVDRPVDKIVEKIVEKPVDRVIEKLVDNPAHLTRITSLEGEVGLLAGLRQTIARLESTPPKIVEKIVDRPVEKIVEKIVDRPVDRIVEKIVDRPVTTIVEKIVDRPVDRVIEKLVDNPVHLGRIKTLEAEVATIAGFRQTISRLEATPPKLVEKIVDRPVDRIVEKVVERPVDRIVEKQIDNPEHLRRIKALEAELEGFRARNVVLDKASSNAAGFTVRGMDDLEIIEGIGPKIAGLFHDAGIHMFWELAETPIARMQAILDAAGPNYKLANPSTWATQSNLAAKNRWAELRMLQDELNAGVKK